MELTLGEPAQGPVLERPRLSVGEGGPVGAQRAGTVDGPDVGRGRRADRDIDAELLAALAPQGLGLGLAGLDLAARELPPARERLRVGALRREDSRRVTTDDCGGDDEHTQREAR